MKTSIIYFVGFSSQFLFTARSLIQWYASEKNKEVMVPTMYWLLSIAGSLLLFIYGYLRIDISIMLGQIITYYIYIRNLELQKYWSKIPIWFRILLIGAPIMMLTITYVKDSSSFFILFNNPKIPNSLLLLGILAQIIFTSRFIFQWKYSEKNHQSVLPSPFWILSIIGSLLILTYGIIRLDIVLIFAHLFGILIYARNYFLLMNSS